MSFQKFNREEFEELRRTLTTQQLAKHFGVAARTIRKWNNRVGPLAAQSLSMFPASQTKVYDDFITLASNRTLILSDCEVPDHDYELFELACKIALRYKITHLILAGDFIALDSFSAWARAAVYKLAFKDEMEPAIQILNEFCRIFERVVYITGNHERRLAHRVDGEITIGDFLTKISGVEYSEYAHCILKSGNREFLVAHPSNYAQIPLSVTRKLASSRLKNIITAHTHHQAMGFDPSGQFYVVEAGCCRDSSRTKYKQMRVTTHPAWNSGFTMCIDGHPFLITKENGHLWLNDFGKEVE